MTKERALRVAIALADDGGLEELTMRRLAQALGVEAMSLYHHVPSKDAIYDGMVDLIFEEIELPDPTVDWKTALRRRMGSLREVLLKHRWALRILESRTSPGVSTLAHHDAVLGCLRDAGFSVADAGHAYSVLDSYVFGFVHTELTLPFDDGESATRTVTAMFDELPAGAFPHLAELAKERIIDRGYTYGSEFPFGLELILEGLERLKTRSRSR